MGLVHTAGGAPLFFGPRAVEKLQNRKTKVTSYNLDLNLIGDYWGWFGSRSYHHTGMVSMWCVSCPAPCAGQIITTEHLYTCMCALGGLATVLLRRGMPVGACENGNEKLIPPQFSPAETWNACGKYWGLWKDLRKEIR